MPSPYFTEGPVVRRICLSARAEDLRLLRSITERLGSLMGRVGYVDAIRYALRLAERHLTAGAEPPTPLSPTTPPTADVAPAPGKPSQR